jgi:hypothetical protein
VWVARWREDVLHESGNVRRVRRNVVLGSVADLPTRSAAKLRLEEWLRPINQGLARPESSMAFGTFAETQWQVLILSTLKLSTQHGYKNVLRKHVFPTGVIGDFVTSVASTFSNGSPRSFGNVRGGKRSAIRGCCSQPFWRRASNTELSKATLREASSFRRKH